MLFLATFFPMSELEEEEGGHKFDFFNDFQNRLGLRGSRVHVHGLDKGAVETVACVIPRLDLDRVGRHRQPSTDAESGHDHGDDDGGRPGWLGLRREDGRLREEHDGKRSRDQRLKALDRAAGGTGLLLLLRHDRRLLGEGHLRKLHRGLCRDLAGKKVLRAEHRLFDLGLLDRDLLLATEHLHPAAGAGGGRRVHDVTVGLSDKVNRNVFERVRLPVLS